MLEGGNLVGGILKKKREELGQDLHEISRTLKIRYDYLKAIEDEEFGKLPEEVYVKGYIREYSKILNIDPEITLSAYVQQLSPSQDENKEIPKNEIVHRKKLKFRYLLILAILILIISVTFIFSSFLWENNKMALPPPETKKEIPSTPEETKPELSPATVESSHILEIFATDTTWLSVKIDDASIEDILLNQGESVKFQAKNGFSLKIGNAGGVKLIFDGKEIEELGEKNEVIKLDLPYSGIDRQG